MIPSSTVRCLGHMRTSWVPDMPRDSSVHLSVANSKLNLLSLLPKCSLTFIIIKVMMTKKPPGYLSLLFSGNFIPYLEV